MEGSVGCGCVCGELEWGRAKKPGERGAGAKGNMRESLTGKQRGRKPVEKHERRGEVEGRWGEDAAGVRQKERGERMRSGIGETERGAEHGRRKLDEGRG